MNKLIKNIKEVKTGASVLGRVVAQPLFLNTKKPLWQKIKNPL